MPYSHGLCDACFNEMYSIEIMPCPECSQRFHSECWEKMDNPGDGVRDLGMCDNCYHDSFTDTQRSLMLDYLFECKEVKWNSPEELRKHMRAIGRMEGPVRVKEDDDSEEEDDESEEDEEEEEQTPEPPVKRQKPKDSESVESI
jgi:hypothetical protein